jgi:hypothetical protein
MLSVMDNIVNIRYKRHNSDNSAKKEKKKKRDMLITIPNFQCP